MTHIVYIHGANSTLNSFNYIKDKLPLHDAIFFNYNTDDGVHTNVIGLSGRLLKINKPVSIVSHSLGGIIGFLASCMVADKIEKLVTISTPFAGSEYARLLRWFNNDQLFKDTDPAGEVIQTIFGCKSRAKILPIISTAGNSPLINGDNDGVVSVHSQLAISKLATPHHVNANHFEVLMMAKTVQLIDKFIFGKHETK